MLNMYIHMQNMYIHMKTDGIAMGSNTHKNTGKWEIDTEHWTFLVIRIVHTIHDTFIASEQS